MSSSAEPQHPASDPGFDPLVFWVRYKNNILLFGGLLVVASAVFGVFEYTQQRASEGAQAQFASAKTPEAYRNVIADYPRSVVAGNATLLLAESLRNESKYDEAIVLLRNFPEAYPTHPLLSAALISLALTQESQSKPDEALLTYQKASTSYPNSFSAPIAMLASAKIYQTKGQDDQARQIYDKVALDFKETNYAREATMEIGKLKKPAPAATEPDKTAVAPAVK